MSKNTEQKRRARIAADMLHTLPETVLQKRTEKGLSRAAASEQIGLTGLQTLIRIERRHNDPSMDVALLLLEWLAT
jgi:DNA-binding XRE family transcriptional regulator